MANVMTTGGKSYQDVKERISVLKRAYDLHFRRGFTWAAAERELGLKSAGGMTAMNCAERYINVTDDPQVRSEGKEWRRKRKIALALRKKQRLSLSIAAPKKAAPPDDAVQQSAITLQQVDERVEQRLREFTGSLAKAIAMAAG